MNSLLLNKIAAVKDDEPTVDRTGLSEKTAWDWFELLSAALVPIILAVFTTIFTLQQSELQRGFEQQQQAIADRRADLTALQGYLDQMGTLLLDRGLGTSKPDAGVLDLARARTLTVLDTLSPIRKPRALEFLFEMDLIQAPSLGEEPIISLRFADLHEADMENRDLLERADLDRANLNRANFSAASLSGAKLSKAHLFRIKLCGTNLSNTDLTHAYLIGANLTGADLAGANLRDADFENANLNKAKGLTMEQVNLALSFKGATMPNGQKYENWVKGDRNLRGSENINPSHCPVEIAP